MPSAPILCGVTALFSLAALILSGCQSTRPGMGRMPAGANTRHTAAVKFFNAYQAHDRDAAEEVATDAAINALVVDDGAGSNPSLRLVDDEHIYYEGGSIELRYARNSAGRWYVATATSRAD